MYSVDAESGTLNGGYVTNKGIPRGPVRMSLGSYSIYTICITTGAKEKPNLAKQCKSQTKPIC